MSETDWQLLQRYTRHQAEDAFTELVRRHLGLVYTAARRQVRSPQLAEEVAQSVFTDLAQSAARLKAGTIVPAWLYQVTRRTAVNVVRAESRRHLREHVATELQAMNATPADWSHIEPLLDDAMSALGEIDRTAILLRFFENKSLREVGAALGTGDDAAQKRVSRAIERLKDILGKHGVTTGAAALATAISGNAVQAAPVNLLATIGASALAASALTATATKAITMTTLQKLAVTGAICAAIGGNIYQANQSANLKAELATLRSTNTGIEQNVARLTASRDQALNQLAASQQEIGSLQKDLASLPKLRGEITMLRLERQSRKAIEEAAGNSPKPAKLLPGFGTLGEFLRTETLADAGNSSAENLLTTVLWAIREGKRERLADFNLPVSPDEIDSDDYRAFSNFLEITRTAFLTASGFHLDSRSTPDGRKYEVAIRAEVRKEAGNAAAFKDFNIKFVLERSTNSWDLGSDFPEPDNGH